ncbi:hypothetical protein SK128_008469, partial [Halocaridina rubra]
ASYSQEDEERYRGEFGASFVGSFPKDYVYGPEDPDQDIATIFSPDQKPKILLMGLRR